MDGVPSRDGPAGFRRRPVWLLAILPLLAGQAALTLALFDAERPWPALTDDRPLLAGRHPLLYYQAQLGARAWRYDGSTYCFDAAFQAGYPKTPALDSGSRPAELLFIVSRAEGPAAYKLSLAGFCLLVPLVFLAAGRVAGLSAGASCLAGLFGALAFWSAPGRQLLEGGDLDWLGGGLALVLHLACLAGFARETAPIVGWCGILASAAVGWMLHPLLWTAAAPLVAAFYLARLCRHGLGWHVALGVAWAGGLAVNAQWLAVLARDWWIRRPFLGEGVAPAPRLWGDAGDQVLLVGLAAAGVAGLLTRGRLNGPARALFGTAALLLAALALSLILGYLPLAKPSAAAPALVAVWLLVVPAAGAVSARLRALGRYRGGAGFAALLGLAGLLAGAPGSFKPAFEWPRLLGRAAPLPVGLNLERQLLTRTLAETTTPEARILWEDRTGVYWTALLPELTGRDFIGGLDPDGGVEHLVAGLSSRGLAGRSLAEWSDADLERFGQRYNIGWVVTWSPAAEKRLRAWSQAKAVAPLHDGTTGQLFALSRPPAFVLKGQARVVQADWRRIALADVQPEGGQIVLSLHHHPGWRATPGSVIVERDPDVDDPVPFLRLRVPGPLLRLTLTWEEP